jgi:SSS family solute:Na+ symporter
MVCYLLTQVTRVGSIMFGVALVLRALLGLDAATIILAMGALVTLYTLLGGIEAVIWTDVVQSIVLTVGAIVIAAMLLFGMPQGPGQVFSIGGGKFSLGGFGADFTVSTFWVVLLYGVFMNLNNFGIDQNYVQRYHTARSEREAKRSVWLGAMLYLPISLLFFFIGSCLFAYYRAHPKMLDEVRRQVAAEKLASERPKLSESAYQAKLASTAAGLKPEEIGDKVLPHYIVHGLPTGMTGLLIAALFAAAMSTIDTSLNSSATITLTDIYKRHVRKGAGERESMRVLHVATLVWGAVGTGVALALIGVESLLDAWWVLSGIFVGGMLGLFLLGLISRRARSAGAAVGACVGIVVILWMSLSLLEQWPSWANAVRSPLHKFMIPVVGTSTIVLMAMLASLVIPRRAARTA